MRTPRSEIAHRFSYHPPNDERKRAHETVRQLCGDLAGYLDEHLPDSREKSARADEARRSHVLLERCDRARGELVNYVEQATAIFNAECPDQDPELVRLYVLLALTTGRSTSLADVHDAWSLWRTETRADHPSIVWFDKLAPDVQELDREYMEAIHRTAQKVVHG